MVFWSHDKFYFAWNVFSRDAATLYERVSLRPLVGPSVTLSFFGLLGATNAVYTAPLLVILHSLLFPFFLSCFLSFLLSPSPFPPPVLPPIEE